MLKGTHQWKSCVFICHAQLIKTPSYCNLDKQEGNRVGGLSPFSWQKQNPVWDQGETWGQWNYSNFVFVHHCDVYFPVLQPSTKQSFLHSEDMSIYQEHNHDTISSW